MKRLQQKEGADLSTGAKKGDERNSIAEKGTIQY
jgi:hypothetical protein